jgi:hypothetical protein
MNLSILKPAKSEVYGLIGFIVCASTLMYIQRYFGGSFDMVTALVVLVSGIVFEFIYNISVDIEVSNK